MTGFKHLHGVLILGFCLSVILGAPIEELDDSCNDESPYARDLEEFRKCHGFKCSCFETTKNVIVNYKLTLAADDDKKEEVRRLLEENPEEKEVIDKDIWPSPQQAVGILESVKARQKRKLATFNSKNQKWESPVAFILQSGLSASVRSTVRKAMRMWGEATCLQFKEFPESYLPDTIFSIFKPEYNILYFHPGHQCASYVGRILWSQPIQLANSCGSNIGAVVHEIGHALGFWHEHQRADRDDYVDVFPEHVAPGIDTWQIEQKGNTQDMVPYDYGSVMHYNAWAFTPMDKASNRTIVPHNSLYTYTIGQKVEISFWDAKLANIAYCQVEDDGLTSLCYHGIREGDCKNDGYQDPKDCRKCRCPDGFAGTYCEEIEPPQKATCGGKFFVKPGEKLVIKTPNYDSRRPYEDHTECTWLVETDDNYRPVFHFDGDRFGTYCYWTRPQASGGCYHWLEVRYGDIVQTGPRFCCDRWEYKKFDLMADIPQMMLLFRSNYDTPSDKAYEKIGFKATITAECVKDCGSQNPATTTTTTTSTTTTTTKPTTTTMSTTTRAATAAPTQKPTQQPTKNPDPQRPMPSVKCTKGNRDKKLDLAFVVDSSGSVTEDNWFKMRNFTRDVISHYSIGPDCLQVGFISYSTDARLNMDFFQGASSVQSIEENLKGYPWLAGWSNTAAGLQMMWTELFSPGRGDRSDAKNMAILITDGRSNFNEWMTPSEAAKAKSGRNVNMVVVGITDKVDDKELRLIASSRQQVYKISEFDDLWSESFYETVLWEIDSYADLGPNSNKNNSSVGVPRSSTHTNTSVIQSAKNPTTTTIKPTTSSNIRDTTRFRLNPTPHKPQRTTTRPVGKDEPENLPSEDFSALDLAFILDSSGSVGETNWAHLLAFIRKFVGMIRVGNDDTLISLVSFGNEASIHFGLKTHTDKYSMTNNIDSNQIEWKDQWTNTASGMLAARYNVFSMDQGNRAWAPDVALLITDGVSNRYNNHTVPEAEGMKRQGINIFVVGVGNRFDYAEAAAITGSRARVKSVSTYDSLLRTSNIESIMKMIGTEVSSSSSSSNNEVWTRSCGFEKEEEVVDEDGKIDQFCGMVQETRHREDNFDWTVSRNGKTPSEETGPNEPHNGDRFIFIEASNQLRGDKAIIYLKELPSAGTYCLTFYYNMYGHHIGKLLVIKKREGELFSLWSKEKDQGGRWFRKELQVYIDSSDDMVGFMGIRADAFSGDIALDDVKIAKGLCAEH